eukprot:342827_1
MDEKKYDNVNQKISCLCFANVSKFPSVIDEKLQNVVLHFFGSFYPIHQNHINIMEIARDHLMKTKKFNVIGGVISLNHLTSLQSKFSSINITNKQNKHRKKILELTLLEHKWIIHDLWFYSQPHCYGVHICKLYLKTSLNRKYGINKVTLINVIGDDNILKFKNVIRNEIVLCVLNRNKLKDIETFKNDKKIKKNLNNLIIAEPTELNILINDCSSTKIRECFFKNDYKYLKNVLHSNILQYHQLHNINYNNHFDRNRLQNTSQLKPWKSMLTMENMLTEIKLNKINCNDLHYIIHTNNDKCYCHFNNKRNQTLLGKGLQASVFEMLWQQNISNKIQFCNVAVKKYFIKKKKK